MPPGMGYPKDSSYQHSKAKKGARNPRQQDKAPMHGAWPGRTGSFSTPSKTPTGRMNKGGMKTY